MMRRLNKLWRWWWGERCNLIFPSREEEFLAMDGIKEQERGEMYKAMTLWSEFINFFCQVEVRSRSYAQSLEYCITMMSCLCWVTDCLWRGEVLGQRIRPNGSFAVLRAIEMRIELHLRMVFCGLTLFVKVEGITGLEI